VLEPGYWVALTVKPETTPLDAYVGEVKAVDSNGVRLTLIDWFLGNASGWDVYVAWGNVEAALVATPEHNLHDFGEAAADWQQRVAERRALEPVRLARDGE
jgi:hypothetical protein